MSEIYRTIDEVFSNFKINNVVGVIWVALNAKGRPFVSKAFQEGLVEEKKDKFVE